MSLDLSGLITALNLIPEELISERKAKQLTIIDLASAVGLHPEELRTHEDTGYKYASLLKIERIAKYLSNRWTPFFLKSHKYEGWVRSPEEWDKVLGLHAPIIEGGIDALLQIKKSGNKNTFSVESINEGISLKEFIHRNSQD